MLQVFDFNKHYPLLESWLKARDMAPPEQDTLPSTGFAYLIGNTEIAIGFLRLAEGKQASIDLLVSNPSQSPKDRNLALNEISKALITLAKNLSIRHIYAHTVEDNVITRAKSMGFEETKQRVLVRKIT